MMNTAGGERPADAGAGTAPGVAIAVDGLTVRLGATRRDHGTIALDDVSVTVRAGGVTGLLGPSGCGKTTLMRSIVGVQRTTAGTVTVLGLPAGSAALRPRIGYVTQADSVYTDLTVRRNLRYFADIAGAPAGAADRAAADVELTPYLDRPVRDLSGGQAHRVSLACALVGDPELLVLDEPTVGLDPLTRENLWDVFRALADRGVTILLSSHVMDEASRCDDLILLRDGRLIATTTPDGLLAATGAPTPDAAFLSLIRRDEAR